MTITPDMLPDDIDTLKAALIAERADRIAAQALAAVVQAKFSDDQALIAHMKLQIEKLRRKLYGQRSERSARLPDQTELQLEELEASASEDELLAEMAAAKTTNVAAFTRKRPARKPFPDHVPRERVIVPGPTSCGGARQANRDSASFHRPLSSLLRFGEDHHRGGQGEIWHR